MKIEDIINLADKEYEDENYGKAFSLYKKAAASGNAYAQYSLGFMYAEGQGVQADSRDAIMWMEKAAEQGIGEAQAWLDDFFGELTIEYTTIDNLIKDLADEESADIAPPASQHELDRCQKELVSKGFPPIPQEYLDFLSKCNGFVWGVHFFGTRPVPDSDPEHHELRDDLITANEDFVRYYDYLKHCLLIGEGFEDMYCYDTKEGIFKTWARDAGFWIDHESFDALFVDANELGDDDEEDNVDDDN
jgi:hypothetical protein